MYTYVDILEKKKKKEWLNASDTVITSNIREYSSGEQYEQVQGTILLLIAKYMCVCVGGGGGWGAAGRARGGGKGEGGQGLGRGRGGNT